LGQEAQVDFHEPPAPVKGYCFSQAVFAAAAVVLYSRPDFHSHS
jgi:hypothetical protein